MVRKKSAKKRAVKRKVKAKEDAVVVPESKPGVIERLLEMEVGAELMFGVVVALLLVGAGAYLFLDNMLPGVDARAQKSVESVGYYGPYEVFKVDDHDYYMRINPEVEWHFRANPQDTVNIPVFPYKKDVNLAVDNVSLVWIATVAEEDPRLIASATEIAKTLGAKGKTVKHGWLRVPLVCTDHPTDPDCKKVIVPLEFANENRTVFRMLGPLDDIKKNAIYVMGNNIIVQGKDYDGLDLAATKVELIMLGLA